MNAVTVKVALTLAQQAAKHWKKIVLIVLSFFMLLFSGLMLLIDDSSNQSGTANVNENVMVWKPVVTEYAMKYDVQEYVDVILAIIMVESGGNALDIMQSSESLGLPPNTITDPIISIDAGVKHFSSVIHNARKNELDFWTPVQSYNYGSGFNNFVRENGKKYSFELGTEFAKLYSGGVKVQYSNPVADFNGNWRYQYGNMYYVKLIQQYLSPVGEGNGIGNADASALGSKEYKTLMNEVLKYQGWPYVWGGSSPSVGFDCSGLLQYAFKKLGYDLPRTAAQQHAHSIPVAEPQPGDLVFFKGTNPSRPADSITHVGIYVDENRMFNSNNSGIEYSDWSQGYWGNHFAGFGRVVK
ncbi:bifunctional lytic transglycosylase/C40 family peptidase [Pontibacillus litoralis]|uniref:NlpC/P60 domain-containing protein n=1 Tax=Pontibacillus litoralis JSM 072002 TaxID=1385512 RepID=A0A0A5FZF4_9BACI|nr:bifunctional lytic transglycosylase/C40 family peptidase [Pontibacillus litoralis]KGX85179.1 hypothetical protein N784_09795 [Pontibacillus litoralis JSM 072002]